MKNLIPSSKLLSLLIPAVLAIASAAFAVDPPPDGGYPNFNTAEGEDALFHLDTSQGSSNTAVGFEALLLNTTGSDNTAIGVDALQSNGTACCNTANGSQALRFNTTGFDNTAMGAFALVNSISGNDNTAIGFAASGGTTGSNDVALGAFAGSKLTTGSNNIEIGNVGREAEANTIRIGRPERQTATYIAGISRATVPNGVAVIVGGNGHLGTITSSARFKEAIKPMDKASETILSLKPMTFRYKHELDPDGIPEFGLVAEQVEKVNPDLVARDADGKPYTVRYEAVNAMLLNEFLKEHRKVQQLEANSARQQKQIDALAAGLQKVSAQLELSKSASQTIVNNQ